MAVRSEVSNAVQDYAKAIWSLAQRGDQPVSTSALAERLEVSPASASAMVKRLESMGLVEHEPYHGVQLTRAGERVALEVLRHHRLLELYLAEALGMSWDRVHEEAEVLEHAISPALSELIAAKLGNPTHDPHGDPIPTADGEIDEAPTRALSDLEPGARGVFVRVSDSDPDMLRYLAERGIAPGDRFEVLEARAVRRAPDGSVRGQSARARWGAAPGDAHSRPVNEPIEAALLRGGPAATRPVVVLEPAPPEPSALEELRSRGRLRYGLGLLGPAFVAAVAYVDPGNFATNVAGGSKYGYLLLWVVLAANLMAMLIQYLSAKVGIATGKNLPELCREHFPRRASIGLWIQAELIAMATDLAEFVGAAIALNLLFGVPLFVAGLITAVVAFAILGLQTRGYRRFETTIAGLLGVILLGFIYEVAHAGPDASGALAGFVPSFDGTESVLLATGILGATVMPHVIYLHSALTQGRIKPRDDAERRELLRFERLDVGLAMGLAGIVNISMLVVAAALFHGVSDIDSIEGAYHGFDAQLGGGAALAFGLALLASGLSSSSVGTYAGQVVMQGFIRRSVPLLLRRLITMLPALVVLALGVNATDALVISQVVLSFGIPFALVPLVLLTRRADVMGTLRNARGTTIAASVVALLIIALNLFLLGTTFAG